MHPVPVQRGFGEQAVGVQLIQVRGGIGEG